MKKYLILIVALLFGFGVLQNGLAATRGASGLSASALKNTGHFVAITSADSAKISSSGRSNVFNVAFSDPSMHTVLFGERNSNDNVVQLISTQSFLSSFQNGLADNKKANAVLSLGGKNLPVSISRVNYNSKSNVIKCRASALQGTHVFKVGNYKNAAVTFLGNKAEFLGSDQNVPGSPVKMGYVHPSQGYSGTVIIHTSDSSASSFTVAMK